MKAVLLDGEADVEQLLDDLGHGEAGHLDLEHVLKNDNHRVNGEGSAEVEVLNGREAERPLISISSLLNRGRGKKQTRLGKWIE